ncbi:hypothetical protein CDAR_614231 [Caerostris darwini]|uniref:Uncharacterized protein n=1 Tax=Caerostris darwini TaxID=1538125 RepID=A0AAV4WBJ4_9ARAC|nr:hypothetical protein CDAR_614231 [Caerostris darwini]
MRNRATPSNFAKQNCRHCESALIHYFRENDRHREDMEPKEGPENGLVPVAANDRNSGQRQQFSFKVRPLLPGSNTQSKFVIQEESGIEDLQLYAWYEHDKTLDREEDL